MKEIEAKLMALIHGELSEEESKNMIKRIETDAELTAVYEELINVSVMVEKTVAPAEQWNMEEGRRSDLLEKLKGENQEEKKGEQKAEPKPDRKTIVIPWRQVTGIAASVAVTLVIAGEVFEISLLNRTRDIFAYHR